MTRQYTVYENRQNGTSKSTTVLSLKQALEIFNAPFSPLIKNFFITLEELEDSKVIREVDIALRRNPKIYSTKVALEEYDLEFFKEELQNDKI